MASSSTALAPGTPLNQFPIRYCAKRAPLLPHTLQTLSFRNVPALLPACAFACGIATTFHLWFPPAILLLALLILATLTLLSLRHARCITLFPLACLFVILGGLASELQPPIDPQEQLNTIALSDTQHTFTGTVVRFEPPQQETYTPVFGGSPRSESTQRLDLRLATSDAAPFRGTVRLSLYTGKNAPQLPALRCGQQLAITFAPHPLTRYNDPGAWDSSAWQRSQGIGALGSTSTANVQVLTTSSAPTIACRIHRLQAQASARVFALSALHGTRHLSTVLTLTPEDTSMLTAMLTGDRSALAHTTRIDYERTGSFHLLVVSGMHLAIFASVIFFLASAIRLPNLAATLLTIVLSFAYAIFTGFGEPVARSLAMVTFYLLARLLFRQRGALQAMSLAALCLLVASPRALGGSSLQMTLLTVIAVGGLAAPLADRTFAPYLRGLRQLWLIAVDASLPPRVAQFRVHVRLLARHLQPVFGRSISRFATPYLLLFFLRTAELLLFSSIVELVMACPMALYFHRFTVLGLPTNVLILPLLGLLLPAALATFATALTVPGITIVPAAITAAMLHSISGIVHLFASLSFGDLRLPGPPPIRIAAWLLLLAVSVWSMRIRPRFGPAIAVAMLLASAALALAPGPPHIHSGLLQVSAIDVGQGDSILVITPDGHTLLIDGGGLVNQQADTRFDMGEEVVSPALWSLGIRHLDAVALTHAHEDHLGGLAAVLANFHPDALWIGKNPHSAHYDALLAEAARLHIPIQSHVAGDRWSIGNSINFQALWPSIDYRPGTTPTNNDSLVLRLTFGQTSALFEGDAEAPAERKMLAAGLTHADLLKVGHHGSTSSSTPAFLAAVCPLWSVISCGRHNFYGHPRPATLEKLQNAHVKTLRTDLSGETTFLLSQHGIESEQTGILQP